MTDKPLDESPFALRRFGLLGAAFCAAFAWLAWRKGASSYPYWAAAAAPLAFFGAFLPEALLRPYRAAVRAALLIGEINAFLLLAFVYFLILTPLAVFRRLLGHPPLDLALRDGESYWRKRSPVEPASYDETF